MSDLWIKICGMTTAEAVDAAVAAGADAVGFVFHAASPRNLTPARAAELAARVPAGMARVAVFLHPSQRELDAVLAVLTPDFVQTDIGDFATLRLPDTQRCLPVLRSGGAVPFAPPTPFLLESGTSGAGQTADWALARTLATRGGMVLGGGLTAANVAQALAQVRPYGVDVSSGVERERGIKDPQRIDDFVAAARATERRSVASGESG